MKYYLDKIKKFSFEKKILLPSLSKIILHTGIAKVNNNKTKIKEIFNSVQFISGQKPTFSKLKKSISNFKSRKKDLAGIYVTLRRNLMWEFYHKLINVVLPNIKEFKGYSEKSLDRFGNINIGVQNCSIFPDFFNDIRIGLNICIVLKNIKKFFLEFYKSIDFPIE